MSRKNKTDAGFYPTLVTVIIISLACLMMLVVLQPGMPMEPDINIRMSYMRDHRNIWLFSWLLWMASAFGLLLFCFYLLPFLPKSRLTYYSLAIIAIGIAPDITAEFIYAIILPWIAVNTVAANDITLQIITEQFRTLEYLAVLLTGGFGNGAYNAGGLMLNILGFRNQLLPRWLLWFGIPSWLLGLALSVSTIINEPFLMRIFTATSMALSLIWMFLIAMIIFRHPQQYQLHKKV